MDDAGDVTMIFTAWTHGIRSVTIDEIYDFCAYSGRPALEILARLEAAGITLDVGE